MGAHHRIVCLLPSLGAPMKWSIRVALTPDGNPPPVAYDIGTTTRPIADLSRALRIARRPVHCD